MGEDDVGEDGVSGYDDPATHERLTAEWRALVEALCERVEPMVARIATVSAQAHAEAAAEDAASDAPRWDGCSWCPVCALAATLRGERHDLVTMLSVQSSVLVTVLREMLDGHVPPHVNPASPHAAAPRDADRGTDGAPAAPNDDAAEPRPPSGYQPISVTVTVTDD
ncbi:hypothetical protein Rrhod_0490 [Rhodococcus rhodnii LMG 5362]|uniref:Uncharacterized protein n=1 Tax=Rhodococcus rhodnii LMG 5362 TaxID=1273125 RepID=R7WS87_9NOCA|nr:hypothetical protein Rrhod_0490 [Rhodococcus rhodnii LMG 5362]